jgi:hypothetical protein
VKQCQPVLREDGFGLGPSPMAARRRWADGGGSNLSVTYCVTRWDHFQRDVDAQRLDHVLGLKVGAPKSSMGALASGEHPPGFVSADPRG